MKVWAVIPARHASTRFPGKMLADLCGRPLLQHVWNAVNQSRLISRIIVATDHEDIRQAVRAFGGEAVMTDPGLPSGTDRVAAAAGQADVDWILNVQGDEPLIRGETLDEFITKLGDFPMATMARRLEDPARIADPNVVKVVTGLRGDALYFSRAPIPFPRDGGELPDYWQHLGIYAYRPDALRRIVSLPPSPLELTEKLEQLRALQNGVAIQVIPTSVESIGVDTPEDLQRVATLMRGA